MQMVRNLVRWNEYRDRLLGFWREYRKSKMGLAGITIILFFSGMALTAPLIMPWPSPILPGQAPPIAAPMWLLPFDPIGFTTVYPIENNQFDSNADGWLYNETISYEGYNVVNNSNFDTNADGWTPTVFNGGGITSTFYNPSEGSDLSAGSGPGCYEFQYNDQLIGIAYGQTDIFLDYDFNWYADKYPPGVMSAHPAVVIIKYSIEFNVDNTPAEFANTEVFFSIEMMNSTGIPDEIYSRAYITTGARPWSPRTVSMLEGNITSTFSGTDLMALRFHVQIWNPSVLDTPTITCRLDDIQCQIRSSYVDTTNNSRMTGEYSATDGSNASGPGSYHFIYEDTDNSTAYFGSTAWIQYLFTWNTLDTPEEVYFTYFYKVQANGAWGDTYLNIIQECYVENTGELIQIYYSDNIGANRPWQIGPRVRWNVFERTDTFGQRGNLYVRFRVLVTDPTPEDMAQITIGVDDFELQVWGNYFGNLGAGVYGEDLWAQLLWGARIALIVGLAAAFIATFVGLIVGLIAGYFGGLVDEILMRITDFFLVIPSLPLMIVLAAILEPRWYNIVLVIALVGWTGTARLVRSQVLAERQKAYVEAAHAIGASDLYIIFRHILPNVTPLLFAQITLGVAGAILSEAGLSFLGLTHPYDVSWGRMLQAASQGGAYTQGAWWYLFFPGMCIVLLAMSFTLVGYAVDEILNPRLRIRKQ
jgi:peptide/nickel transport system permease protein